VIVGFSKYGRGKAAGAIKYLTERERDGIERQPAPTVLRGDPELVSRLIDSLRFKNRYTSGVLSFAPGERVTPEMESDLMDRFERAAFAGLKPDQYSILWVRHEHAGHAELNFLVPRVELETNKSLNIAPPGQETRELFGAFRSQVNLEYGFADPDDPRRARKIRLPHHIAKFRAAEVRAGRKFGEDPRTLIADAVSRAIDGGQIGDRAGVISFLKAAGFEINREGVDYLSVRDAETSQKYRLKGPQFDAEFRREQFSSQIAKRQQEFDRPGRAIEITAKLNRLVNARAKYNRSRYDRRRGSRASFDHDLSRLAEELTSEARGERKILEIAGLYDRGAVSNCNGINGDNVDFRSQNLGANNGKGANQEHDAHQSPSWRLHGSGSAERAIFVDSQEQRRRAAQPLPMRKGRSLLVPPSAETLADDRDRTAIGQRIGAFGKRLREAGSSFARLLAEVAASFERAFRSADQELDSALRRYEETARTHDRSLQRFTDKCRRFNVATGRTAEAVHRLIYQLSGRLQRNRDRSM